MWVLLFASVERFLVSRLREFFVMLPCPSVCVCVSVCLSICAIAEHPLPGELKKIWSKAVSLIFTYVEYVYFSFLYFFLLFWHFWSHPSVDHPTVDNGGIRRGGSVDVAVFISDK